MIHIEVEFSDSKIVKCINNLICAQNLLKFACIIPFILISNKIYILQLFLFFINNRSGISPSSENLPIFRESRKKGTQRERLNRMKKVVLELAKIKGRLHFNYFNLNEKVNLGNQETEKVHKFCLYLKHYHQYSVIEIPFPL